MSTGPIDMIRSFAQAAGAAGFPLRRVRRSTHPHTVLPRSAR
jgi:hypothetical protein